MLLDFLWMTERHDLCAPASLICKGQKTAERVTEMLRTGKQLDLLDAEEKAEKDAVKERENALAKQLEEMKKRKRKTIDPLQFAVSIQAEDLVNYEPTFVWEMGPASEKQIALLEKFGFDREQIENKGKASLLIGRIMKRRQEGLSTPKQIKALEKFGFCNVGTWSFRDASDMLSRLANCGWRVPRGVIPSKYRPEAS